MSPLLSAVRVVASTPFNLPIDIFINKDKIHKVDAPLLVMHGMVDRVIDYNHGHRLYNLATNTVWKHWWPIPGADHNDIFQLEQAAWLENMRSLLHESHKQ